MNRFEKAAIEVIQPFVKNKITHIIPDKSRSSVLSLDEAKTLAEAMDASARYGALNDTQVHLNGAKITGFQNRAVENKRNTNWTKMMAGISDPFANMPDKSKNVPDAFFPTHDAVWLPSGNPGIMMHELGHAADMNEFPNTPFRRLVAGTYQNFSPTIWKEHAAWIKGKNRLIEGAAKTKVDPNLIVRTLEDAARVKPVGLGSYWGGGLGAIMGGGLGFAAALKGAPPQASALGLVLGASAGAFTGLQLGKMYGNSDRLGSEKAKQGYLDIYANQYAKEHGITLDKAKIELNNFIKAKKKGPIAKAAAFGAMMGKKASLLKSGMTFDAEDYLYDTKPVNFLYNGQPSWMIRDGDTLPPTAWDGRSNALSGSMYPVTRKGKLIQEPDEAELKRYYLAGLNKKLQVPGAKARAWYAGSAEVPEKKRRLWGLLPDKLNYDFKDEDFHDIEHGATPEARQEFINRLSDVLHGRPHAGRVEDFQALGEPMGKLAAGDTWTAPNAGDFLPKGNQPAQQPRYTADNLPRPAPLDGKAYSARENDIYKTRQDMHRKADAVRSAAGAYGPGTSTGTIREGVVQPGATFTPQGGPQGSPQAAPSTPMQRWNQRVSDNAKAQAVKNKGTDKEIQSSSYTNPNAASFLPKPGSNTQNSPAPANATPKPATAPVMESKTPKRLF